jgi:hypothetical protein
MGWTPGEPRGVYRKLHSLRGWGHGETESVFPGGAWDIPARCRGQASRQRVTRTPRWDSGETSEGRRPLSRIYVPPRYRVRFNANFQPAQPVQVEVDLLPSGVFGIQDGRTLRRAESGPSILFDQKTGAVILQESDGQPVTLDAVSLDGVSLGIGRPFTIAGNRIRWTEPVPSGGDVEVWTRTLEELVHMLLGVLPMLGYRRSVKISVHQILLKQQDQVAGWAELLSVNFVARTYKRETIEQELHGFDSWLQSTRLDTARWWAVTYYCRAIRYREESPFLDDSYAEIVNNFWKATEAILGTWNVKKVEEKARSLGLTDEIGGELKWLCQLRHSDDVAHAVVYRKLSVEQFAALYGDRDDKVRRAANVVRATIDHVLGGPSSGGSPRTAP